MRDGVDPVVLAVLQDVNNLGQWTHTNPIKPDDLLEVRSVDLQAIVEAAVEPLRAKLACVTQAAQKVIACADTDECGHEWWTGECLGLLRHELALKAEGREP